MFITDRHFWARRSESRFISRKNIHGFEVTMANFPTHLGVGAVVSGMLTTVALASGFVEPQYALPLAAAGTIGAILPDIDLKESRPSGLFFFILALIVASIVMVSFGQNYSIAETWLLWIGAFLTVRYFVHILFHHYAVHRGVFHSLIAALFFSFATTATYYHGFDTAPGICWLAGVFMFLGYCVHLILDEVYSVDFSGVRIKRSFGTAMKIIDMKHPMASFLMICAAVGAFYLTPSFETFYDAIATEETWAHLRDNLFPDQGWFGWDFVNQKWASLVETNKTP